LSPCIVEAIANGTAPRYNHAERFSVIRTRKGFGVTSRIDGASTAPTSPIDIGTGVQLNHVE
jgi:hypothetical protein